MLSFLQYIVCCAYTCLTLVLDRLQNFVPHTKVVSHLISLNDSGSHRCLVPFLQNPALLLSSAVFSSELACSLANSSSLPQSGTKHHQCIALWYSSDYGLLFPLSVVCLAVLALKVSKTRPLKPKSMSKLASLYNTSVDDGCSLAVPMITVVGHHGTGLVGQGEHGHLPLFRPVLASSGSDSSFGGCEYNTLFLELNDNSFELPETQDLSNVHIDYLHSVYNSFDQGYLGCDELSPSSRSSLHSIPVEKSAIAAKETKVTVKGTIVATSGCANTR